jgi:DNA repair protein RadC
VLFYITLCKEDKSIKSLETVHLKIQDWAKDDRPREKLLQKGCSALTDAELLGILLGSGTKHISAVTLAQMILSQHNHDLNELAKRSIPELQKFKGIGEAKAITIVSAMELGRRRKSSKLSQKPKIHSSYDIYQLMKIELIDKLIEQFWIVLLTRTNYVIRKLLVSSGGTARLAVDPKVIFKTALENNAASIILVHNHPSNNPQPSQLDIELTERLLKAGKLLDIPVVDHVIFTEDSYFSFADEQVLI